MHMVLSLNRAWLPPVTQEEEDQLSLWWKRDTIIRQIHALWWKRKHRGAFVESLHVNWGDKILKLLQFEFSVPVHECEDLRQKIYVKLLDNDSVLPKHISLKWLVTVCKNTAFNYHEKKDNEGQHIVFEENRIETWEEDDSEKVVPTLTNRQTCANWQYEMDSNATERISSGLELAKTFIVSPEHKVTAYMLIAHVAAGLNGTEIGKIYGVEKQAVNKWLKKWYKFAKAELGSKYTE